MLLRATKIWDFGVAASGDIGSRITCIRSAFLVNRLLPSCSRGVDFWHFLAGMTFSFLYFQYEAFWLPRSSRMYLCSQKSIWVMIHTLEIHPSLHGGSGITLKLDLHNTATPVDHAEKHIERDCTVLYYTLYHTQGILMHHVPFWSYSSFQRVNNS